MKKKFFFLPLLAALALTGCSSEELQQVNPTPDEAGFSDNYMTVAIEMPTGTRAEYEQESDFKEGTANESNVSNVVFFFFDDNNVCVDIQKKDNPKFTMQSSVDPNIENVGNVEIRLKSALNYKKVAVVLNSTAGDANTLKAEVKNADDLKARIKNYVENVIQTGADAGKGQVMSNSIYYKQENANNRPTPAEQIFLVEITDDNIYTSADRAKITEEGGVPTGKKHVEIFVERVAARVDVSEAKFNMENYYIYEENGEKKTTVTTYDYINNTTKEITIRPIVKGVCLNVLTPTSRLIKYINEKEVGYGTGSSSNNSGFRWNSFLNRRTYWATTDIESESTMTYLSWNDAEKQGSGKFTQYINPNTQAFLPITSNEENSMNTKVMVVAELREFKGNEPDEEGTVIDLVRYGGDYMLSESLFDHVAYLANVAVRNIDWKKTELKVGEGENEKVLTPTEEQINIITSAVSHAFETGMNRSALDIVMKNPEENNQPGVADWEAQLKYNGFDYNLQCTLTVTNKNEETGEETKNTLNIDLDDAKEGNEIYKELGDAARKIIAATIEDVITSANAPVILYWKGGKTYFYHIIRHQGFYGLVGNGAKGATDDFLYGVVRNHIYDVELNGIFGLGTPVIEPGRPIDPERPTQERPSFIKARINVLKWRVVNNSATVH